MTTLRTPATPLAVDLPDLPGLSARAFDPGSDYPAVARFIRATHVADGTEYVPSEAQVRAEWSASPLFDAARDATVVELDDRIVGLVRVAVRERIDTVAHPIQIKVAPAHRRVGIGSALLHWAEARVRETVARGEALVTDKPRVFVGWCDTDTPGAVEFAAAHGYATVRHFFLMTRDLRDPIVDRPLPDGVEVRPVLPRDHRSIWDADIEAFLDHFETSMRTEGDYEAFFGDENLDTSLWQVAWDGDEVAGSVLNAIPRAENERLGLSRGWLEHVSVRRPWRGRGLASALIARSLTVLRDRGLEEAALGVDSENPTGALGVYERAGFVRHKTSVTVRKPFEEAG